MSQQARAARYVEVSAAFAPLSDGRLDRLVATARPIGSGIGGSSALLDVAGVPVFVKRIPLTNITTTTWVLAGRPRPSR